ncbi:MAG: ATP-dependent zinc metalloprotease FtsH [Solirubrobacterales bacterium]
MSQGPTAPDESSARALSERDPGAGEKTSRKPWKVDPAPDGRGERSSRRPAWLRAGWPLWAIVAVLLAANFVIASSLTGTDRAPVPYSPFFLDQVRDGNVKEISTRADTIEGTFVKKIEVPEGDEPEEQFETQIPAFADGDALTRLLEREDVTVNARSTSRTFLETVLFGFGPTLLFVGLLFFVLTRLGGGMLGGFTGSKAKQVNPDSQTVGFDDVAGIEEAKHELAEVVDFLRHPERYRKLGARIPRGVLLSGLPGTGKTLLARAVAGEAAAPFFSASASEFIEMIVGVGASRVRDLFTQAKEAAPAIIFIDELDAIGGHRGGGSGIGGHNEREQTLNQILTEMDGFESSDEVIVLGATNRPDTLDSALLRPGRFDRRVTVQAPDATGRRAILDVHARHIPCDDDVDFEGLASSTPGMVGADLANLVNEAALVAARHHRSEVRMADFTAAMERIVLGAERKILMSDDDRRLTAYHEAGHAIVGMLTPGADPVRKVSIIPRGLALGVTFAAPDTDRFSYSRTDLQARLMVMLGGRVAEELVFGEITNGAESDIEQLTQIARKMVGRWGMSERVGPIAALGSEAQGPLHPGADETSERTQQLVDAEVQRIVNEAHAATTELLTANRERLDALAAALLSSETLDQPEAYAAAGVEGGQAAVVGVEPL